MTQGVVVDTTNVQRIVSALVVLLTSTAFLGCGFTANEDVFDPTVLGEAAREGVGLPRDEMFDRVRTALAQVYPGLIDQDTELRWVLNDSDDGVPGQVAVLYGSNREYLVFVGSPVGTEWSLGPSTAGERADCGLTGGFEITDFVLEGELLTYAGGDFEAESYGPGDQVSLAECTALAYRIPDTAWMLEYGRGNLPSTLYAAAFASRSLVADLVAGLPSSIINELIRNLVNDAFGLSGGFGGFF